MKCPQQNVLDILDFCNWFVTIIAFVNESFSNFEIYVCVNTHAHVFLASSTNVKSKNQCIVNHDFEYLGLLSETQIMCQQSTTVPDK